VIDLTEVETAAGLLRFFCAEASSAFAEDAMKNITSAATKRERLENLLIMLCTTEHEPLVS
jgi:hypothetical protein